MLQEISRKHVKDSVFYVSQRKVVEAGVTKIYLFYGDIVKIGVKYAI